MPETGKTTMQTLDARKADIDLTLLPKTLRDAIYVTRSLDTPFIWIDALCIIQGDEEDWRSESVQMAQVYSNAVVMIAAEKARHCNEGFVAKSQMSHLWARNETSMNGDDGFLRNRTPPSKRGWALQERELASRSVHFNEKSVAWRCKRELLYYSRISKPGVAICDSNESLTNYYITRNMTISLIHWRRIVEDFSSRSFSNVKDKFPALLGLVIMMGKKINSRHLAGSWECEFSDDLLWTRAFTSSQTSNTLSPLYLAPSWSWLSVNFAVRYNEYHYVKKGHSVKAKVTRICLIEDGPYFLPRSFVCIYSQLKPLLDSSAAGVDNVNMIIHFDDGSTGTGTRTWEMGEVFLRISEAQKANTTWQQFSESENRKYSQYRELWENFNIYKTYMICEIRSVRYSRLNIDYFEGLILQATGKAENEYKRVGIARFIPLRWFDGKI